MYLPGDYLYEGSSIGTQDPNLDCLIDKPSADLSSFKLWGVILYWYRTSEFYQDCSFETKRSLWTFSHIADQFYF